MPNTALIPSLSSADAKLRHDPDAWKLFARRIQRHPFIRAFIYRRDGGQCQYCSRPAPNQGTQTFHLHHTDYDHACGFNRLIAIATPTEKRPNRQYKGPDCEACQGTRPDLFAACTDRIVLVHPKCNQAIELRRKAEGD